MTTGLDRNLRLLRAPLDRDIGADAIGQFPEAKFSPLIESVSHPLPRPAYAWHRRGEHHGWD